MLKSKIRSFWIFSLLTICSLVAAQENCSNGIDDDGDGLIDLNDTDCECGNILPLTEVHGSICLALRLRFIDDESLEYQWYKDGIAITDETGSKIILNKFIPNVEGTYQAVSTRATGCIMSEPYEVEIHSHRTDLGEIRVCAGDTVFVDPYFFVSPGPKSFDVQATDGCDSTVRLQVVMDQATNNEIVDYICPGGTYEFGEEILTDIGWYRDTLTRVSGCDSIVQLQLQWGDYPEVRINESICRGQTYDFLGEVLDESGDYASAVNYPGVCDTNYILTLNVTEPSETVLSGTFCAGGSYEYENETYGVAGSYEVELVSHDGCDSIILLELVELTAEETFEEEVICQGQELEWYGATYNGSGFYEYIEEISTGCEVNHYLELIVTEPEIITETVSICMGQVFEYNDIKESTPGSYETTIIDDDGCERIEEYNLVVLENSEAIRNEIICQNDTIDVEGYIITAPGTYTQTIPNHVNCDSVITILVAAALLEPTPLEVSICPGDSYDFYGENLTDAGEYSSTLLSEHGCDSIINLSLQIDTELEVFLDRSICAGEMLELYGQQFDEGGTHAIFVPSSSGCDTLVQLSLEVNQPTTADLSKSICDGESFEFHSLSVDSPGIYTVVIPNSNGCDSTIVLKLDVLKYDPVVIEADICEGDIYVLNFKQYTTEGSYEQQLLSYDGCDSMVILDLKVSPLREATRKTTLCEGTEIEFCGNIISEAGSYTCRKPNAVGCDSIINYEVEFVTSEYSVDLGEDLLINVGSTIDLMPEIQGTFNDFEWYIDGELVHVGDQWLGFQPLEDLDLTLIAITEHGCELRERIRIDVELLIDVYIPNVFSPDDDGSNDYFQIGVNESVVGIKEILIYDRWGEKIYSSSHQGQLGEYLGWDGKMNGRYVAPGVYTYSIVLDIINGTSLQKIGTLTLVR